MQTFVGPQALFCRLLPAALLLFATPLGAQQGVPGATLRGTVTGEAGSPIAGAQVIVVGAPSGTRRGVIALGDGSYRVPGLGAGTYRVEVRAIGYALADRAELTLAAGEERVVDFRLELTPVELSALQVTGQRNRFTEAYERTRGETEVEAETTRDFNSANAYDALRIVPGVSFLEGAGGRNGKPSRIRGASTWAIPDVIEDFPSVREAGIGAEDGGLTADFGASIPSIAIEDIEVKKGSLGVLYSGDADGGVIVNRLKRGRPGAPTGTLWLEASPLSEQLLMADVGGGTRTLDYYVAGKLLRGDYSEIRDERGRVLSDDRFRSGLARVGFAPTERIRLEAIALRGRDRIDYTEPKRDDRATEMDESTALPPNEFETTNTSGFYGATLDHAVAPGFSYELGYSRFDNHALRFSLTEDQAHRDRPERTHTLFGNAYLDRELAPGVRYAAKLGFERVAHRQEENARGSDKEQRFLDRSVFVASSLSLGERLSLSGGVRYLDAEDDFEAHDLLLYDLGAAYELPLTRTRLYASYSTGYSRNKGFAYFFGPIEQAGGVELSENSTLEAGFDQPLPGIGGEGSVSVTAFRSTNAQVPVFSGWGAGVVHYEERDVAGVEAFATYPLARSLSLLGSFTWMDTEVVGTTHPEGLNVGSTGVSVPRYTGAFGAEWTPAPRLRMSLLGSYDDGMRTQTVDLETGEVTVTTNQAFTRLNLTSSYEVSRTATVRLRVENLLDETDLGYSRQTLGPEGWSFSDTVAQDPGRFASLAIVLKL